MSKLEGAVVFAGYKKTINPTLIHKERFIAYAKEVEADESGETFTRTIKKMIKKK